MSNTDSYKFVICDVGTACATDAGPGRLVLTAHWAEDEERLKKHGWKLDGERKICSRCVFVVD